jgi:hypothetical protein
MNWIHLAQDRDQRMALVNIVMNPWVPQNVRSLLSGLVIVGSEEGLDSME